MCTCPGARLQLLALLVRQGSVPLPEAQRKPFLIEIFSELGWPPFILVLFCHHAVVYHSHAPNPRGIHSQLGGNVMLLGDVTDTLGIAIIRD